MPGSVVEIKCDKCNALNTVTPTPIDRMAPDGQGGLTPVMVRVQ